MQTRRFSNIQSSDIVCNDDIRVGEIRQFCKVGEEGQWLMWAAMTQLNHSARAYHRILKLAGQLPILRRVKRSSPCIWQKRCNTV
jgi:magnesium chelatase family protein